MENKFETEMLIVKEIAQSVKSAGGSTFLVGGIVRDHILGIDNKDIDIEVHGITPSKLEDILSNIGEVIRAGVSFGVFGIRGYDIDIAMPRSEKANGYGHRDFDISVDPYLGTVRAAMRRDFTINAIMQDVLTGEIVDYFGGVQDLKDGVIRHVNDDTFAEDPLRALRAAQFAARFGFRIDDRTVNLIKSMELSTLASERVMGELEKALLKSNTPSIFFKSLKEMEQLDVWFPEIKALIDVPQNEKYHPEGDAWNHTMLVIDTAASMRNKALHPLQFMMAALMHDLGKATSTTIDENGTIRSIGHEEDFDTVENALLRLTNEVKLKEYVHNMVKLHMRPNSLVINTDKQKSYNKVFDLSVCPEDLLLISKSDKISARSESEYREYEKKLQDKLRKYNELMKEPYVMGRDLVEAGIKPSKKFNEMLAFAHKLRLAGVVKEEALKQTLATFKCNR